MLIIIVHVTNGSSSLETKVYCPIQVVFHFGAWHLYLHTHPANGDITERL